MRGQMEFTKIAELEKMKEDLKEAKEEATQSWLDSRPLIDELERIQAELGRAKERVAKASITISELQSQLETTNMRIQEKEEESYTMINAKNQALHKAQEEMEQLKVKRDQKRRTRSRLKLVLRLKRQSLRTLQLTCEAIQLESEAFATSAAQALHHINNYSLAENNNMVVQLTQPEYDYLKKEAREQTSVAERRILACAEEKLAAEKSRDLAFTRLQKLYPNGGTERKQGINYTQSNGVNNKRTSQQQSGYNSRFIVKRKKSIFFRIKTFIRVIRVCGISFYLSNGFCYLRPSCLILDDYVQYEVTVAVRLVKDPKTQRPKGFGVIKFASELDARMAG